MTHIESIKELSSNALWSCMQELTKHPLIKYANIPAWLDADIDKEIVDFVKFVGEGTIIPSEAEIINALCGKSISDADREVYITEHSKKTKILETTVIYGSVYYVVMNEEQNRIEKIPEAYFRNVTIY